MPLPPCYDPAALTRLAVIVPTLDEEENLRRLLPALRGECDVVVVSDGGSDDASVTVARGLGARVVEGPAGRGGQLNRGAAAAADADVLLFLHADTRLPPGACERVRAAVAAGDGHGAFYLRFDHPALHLRIAARLINLRTRLTGLPLGDQAQWVTAERFRAVGGFRDWPILEDLDLMRRLKRHARPVLLAPPVVTAARRYVRGGFLRTVARNWLIWLLYAGGVSPHRLASLYRSKVR